MRRVYTPPILAPKSTGPLAGALGLTLLVFLILPFTQLFSSIDRNILELRQIEVALPPPPPPPQQPPPEEKKTEEMPELKEKAKPLNLSQLELVLNPGTGGALEGDFALGFQMAPNAVEEMKIFELSEVDKEPQLIFQSQPNYPPKAYRERTQGTVIVQFVVDVDGSVFNASIKQRSRSFDLDNAAMNSVMRYKFTPGTKDGRPVRVKYEVPVTFKL